MIEATVEDQDRVMDLLRELHARDLRLTDQENRLRNLESEFNRYREYTAAVTKQLMHERRSGPVLGAPGTEKTTDYLVGKNYRIVSYR